MAAATAAATAGAAAAAPTITLTQSTAGGPIAMPAVGLGTWKSKPGEVKAAVKAAIAAGYRHIDCAMAYQNEAEIGQALQEVFAEGKVRREDLFICSKLWNTCHRPEHVRQACEQTLKDLQTPYLDLYIVHWPVAFEFTGIPFTKGLDRDEHGNIKFAKVSLQQTWEAMEALVDAGLVKAIGVSNYPLITLLDLLTYARIRPAVNQIEVHPYWTREELVSECHRLGVRVVGYSCLGSGQAGPLQDPAIQAIAQRHGKSPAQVIIRWLVQRGIAAIPKSVHEERIRENFAVFDFALTDEEVAAINALNRNQAFVDTRIYWQYAITV